MKLLKKYALYWVVLIAIWGMVIFTGINSTTRTFAVVLLFVVATSIGIVRSIYEAEHDYGKIKMYCLCSKEALDKMKGIRGKMISMGGHAYLHAFWDAENRFSRVARLYRNSGHAYKITLVVPTEDDLKVFEERYRPICGVSLVKDAGITVFKNPDGSPCPTITYLGLGPILEADVGDDLRALKTLT